MSGLRNSRRLYVVERYVSPGYPAEWAQWMQAAGMSRRTIQDRVQLLDRFGRATQVVPTDADWTALAAFLAAAPSAGTRYTYYVHLRAWYRWLVLMDVRIDDPTMKLRAPRPPRRQPRPVTLTQLDRIFATRMHRRSRTMVLLAAYEGLRAEEIGRFRGEQIHDDVLLVTGKGGVIAELPVHELIAETASSMPSRGWWFPSHVRAGEPTLGNSVSAILSGVMRRAGLRHPYTGHSLRHFFGTHVLRSSGGNLVVTQQLMRHASVATTTIYTEIDDSARRAAIAALPVPPHARAA